MMRRLAAFLVFLTLASCTPYQLISVGEVKFGDRAQINTPIEWNWRPYDRAHTMTLDGPYLQELKFYLDIEEGETLLRVLDVEKDVHPILVWFGKLPDNVSFKFHKRMTEHELMDMFAASMAKLTESSVSTSNLAPYTLGGEPGFRFDFEFAGKDNVRRTGSVFGAVRDGKLTLVEYTGTAFYHYKRNIADVERIVASFKFLKEKEGNKKG